MSQDFNENVDQNIQPELQQDSPPQAVTEPVPPQEAHEVREAVPSQSVPPQAARESVPAQNEPPRQAPQYEQPQYAQPQAAPVRKNDGSTGKAVLSLVLGITAVTLSCTLYLGLLGLVCGIVGLIFGIKERKEHPSGIATAAFVLSLIGLILGALSTIACVACTCFFGYVGYSGYFDDPSWLDTLDSMDGIYY